MGSAEGAGLVLEPGRQGLHEGQQVHRPAGWEVTAALCVHREFGGQDHYSASMEARWKHGKGNNVSNGWHPGEQEEVQGGPWAPACPSLW